MLSRRSDSTKSSGPTAAAPAEAAAAATATGSQSPAVGAKQPQQQQQQPHQAGSASTSGVSSSNSSNSNSSFSSVRPARGQAKPPAAAGAAAVPPPGCGGSNGGAAVISPGHSGNSTNGDNYFSGHAMQSLKEAFNFFDIDHDGRITSGELQKVLKFLGTKVTEQEVKLMIADVDTDGNGTVEFEEFLKMMKKYYTKNSEEHSEDADMWEAFKAFDHNGDNFIDFAEIKKTMHFLGEEVSDEDVRSMIREADVDNDGRINFEEFKKMMAVMQQKASQS